MKKLPVVDTIKAAYLFVFAQLGSIIGLIWLPMVIVTVMGFFVEQRYYAAAADAFASNNYANIGPSMLGLFCYFIAALLLCSAMFVPVMQLALGQRKGGTLLHFAFGPAEWRLFRAILGLVAFMLIPVIAAGLLIEVVLSQGLGGRTVTSQLAVGGLELVLVLAYCGIVYIALRFAFLLPAVAVNEEGPVLPRAWKLSAGNFWRIFAIVLATVVPVELLQALAEVLLEGPQALMPNFTSSAGMAAAQLHSMSLNMPVSAGIGFLVAPLILGLAAGASAAAFTALQIPQNSVTDI